MKQSFKTFLVWIIFIGLFVLVFQSVQNPPVDSEMPFSDFVATALPKDGPSGVAKVRVTGDVLEGELVDGTKFKTVGDLKEFQKDLVDRKVSITYESETANSFWVSLLTGWLPMIFFVLLFFFIMRQAQSGGGKVFSFGKSRHRVLSERDRKSVV